MFCWKCGAEIPEDAKFCTKCGATLEKAPEINGSNPEREDAVGQNLINNGFQTKTSGGNKKKIIIASAAIAAAVIVVIGGVSFSARNATKVTLDQVISSDTGTHTASVEEVKNAKVGDVIKFGSYEQDNDTTNGDEPIEWQILGTQNGHTVLLSKNVLDCKEYNEKKVDVTWENCTLRSWLNNDFYNTAFSASEQERIVTAHNENPDSYKLYWLYSTGSDNYGGKGGSATDDKVFLLSWTEARDYLDGRLRYDDIREGNCNRKLFCSPTAYAEAHGVASISLDGGNVSSTDTATIWWLRSPGCYQDGAAIVDYNGAFNSTLQIHIASGVRPVILIDEGNDNASTEKVDDNSKKSPGDIVKIGSYEQDNDLTNGKEPIEWFVLGERDGKTLLLSRYVLDCKRYNETMWSSFDTWEKCTLRSWLNNDFYNTAFSTAEKKRIVTAYNANPDSYELYKPYNGSGQFEYSNAGNEGGKATDDKVFLLSWKEARDYLDGKLFLASLDDKENNNKKLLCSPTAYAKAQGIQINSNSKSSSIGCCVWWLRSPGASSGSAACVGYDGAISGASWDSDDYSGGVRPAILIDSENDNGNNTQSSTEKTQSNNKDSTNQVNWLHRDPAYDLFGDTTAR